MPEGHTIHRIARRLGGDLAGSRVRSSAVQPRFAATAKRLDGRVLDDVEAYGKHLFVRFAGDMTIHIHLGLFGRFRRLAVPAPDPVGALRWRLEGENRAWDLRGPTACEPLDEDAERHLLGRLGPDPLRRDADPSRFVERAAKSRRAIGALLLDQAVISGIGNVYRSEFCFAAGLHPTVPSRSVGSRLLGELWDLSVRQLRAGERSGRIVTVDPAEVGAPSAARVPRGQRTYVYGQTRCLRCGGNIERFELGGRTAFACPNCQAVPAASESAA